MKTQFRLYAKGIVASSKELNSDDVAITLVEFSGAIDGEINSDTEEIIDTGIDANGQPYQINVTLSNTIVATWLNLADPNRITAPDVVVGTPVLVYRYGTNDKYYWETIGKGNFRLETIINRISNNRNPKDVLNDDNSVWSKQSTHEKILVIQTPKNDGEFCRWTVYIDMKNGNAGISNDIGDRFYIDAKEKIVEMENSDNSIVSCNKESINIFSKDKINIETRSLNIKANDITTTADSLSETIATINSTVSNWTVNADNYSLTASFEVDGDSAFSGGDITHNDINIGFDHKHADGTGAMGNTGIVVPV